MAAKDRTKDKKVAVGGFLTASILLALVAIIIISGKQGLFKHHYEIRARMEQVSGLQVGAPVWLAGVNVGSVSEIIFIPSDSSGKTCVEVRMKIKKSVQKYIRRDSKARIGTLGLLGDKYVAITLGSADQPMLEDGDYIQCTSPIDFEELLSRSVNVVDDVTEAIHSFKGIAEKINRGEGTVGQLINNPKLSRDLERFFALVNKMVESVESDKSTIGLLFRNPSLYYRLDTMFTQLSSLASALYESRGILRKVLSDTMMYARLSNTIARLDSLTELVSRGEGTIGAAMRNRELYERLNSAAATLDSLVKEIKKNPKKYINVRLRLF